MNQPTNLLPCFVFFLDLVNTSPLAVREGMVRVENATDISVTNCILQDAGHAAVWLEGYSMNVTIDRCWLERAGFCGVYANGPFPGDTVGGLVQTAEESFMNKGHRITNNVIHDFGQRVGHGAGAWFYQSGENTLSHNRCGVLFYVCLRSNGILSAVFCRASCIEYTATSCCLNDL